MFEGKGSRPMNPHRLLPHNSCPMMPDCRAHTITLPNLFLGCAQSLPVVGEVLTAAEVGSKTAVGAVCDLCGDHKAAQDLRDGAQKSWENYKDVSLITSNIRAVAAEIEGDDKEAKRLWSRQGEALSEFGKNAPVLGHAIGIGYYIAGNSAEGDHCMMVATRTTVVAGVTFATGAAGPLICAGAAVAAGAGCDVVETGINSLGQGKYAPVGGLAAIETARNGGSADDFFNAFVGPVTDAASGALYGRSGGRITRASVRQAKTGPHPVTPTPAATDPPRLSMTESLSEYRRFEPSGRPQASRDQVEMVNPNAFRSFTTWDDMIEDLKPSTKYDFVRLESGAYRRIAHPDSARIGEVLQKWVGHTSLVDEIGWNGSSAVVVAAGEIIVDSSGKIANINHLSGHFKVPVRIFSEQVGKSVPKSAIKMVQSPVMMRLILFATSIPDLPTIEYVVVYTSYVLAIVTENDGKPQNPLRSSKFLVLWREEGVEGEGENEKIETLSFMHKTSGEAAYENVTSNNKMLYTTSYETWTVPQGLSGPSLKELKDRAQSVVGVIRFWGRPQP
ncbi:hypothetical protein ATEIFO6365_0002000300 [Aspergillus terreus]|uniref:Uncharacterized protein n=1 Tax=Aspergillus terreus TaxID=33178 RepID=A0A5M3YX76_ASPTE|nr:hypothetical protein ATETN484_0004000300 [Aspergillus terreus]GFF12893.1 hypothetical protein ATEIFO6365_0002000300 [Aspergillus terreus]